MSGWGSASPRFRLVFACSVSSSNRAQRWRVRRKKTLGRKEKKEQEGENCPYFGRNIAFELEIFEIFFLYCVTEGTGGGFDNRCSDIERIVRKFFLKLSQCIWSILRNSRTSYLQNNLTSLFFT